MACRARVVGAVQAHQRTQAEQAGFKIDKVVTDEGISGVSTRLAERPEGKRLFDVRRRRHARPSLGRSPWV